MAVCAAKNCTRDCIQLGGPALFHIFLHRTAQEGGEAGYSGDHRLCVDLGTFGNGHSAGLPDAGEQSRPPLIMRQVNPNCESLPTESPTTGFPVAATFKLANGDRWTNLPGPTLSASTAIVAGMTRCAPYLARNAATCSIPLSSGTMARICSAVGRATRAASSCVAFTVIHRTSTGGTMSECSTGTRKWPNGLSSSSSAG